MQIHLFILHKAQRIVAQKIFLAGTEVHFIPFDVLLLCAHLWIEKAWQATVQVGLQRSQT